MHPKKERTFVILKPDAVQRGLVGEIIQRFERIGLKIVAMKMHTVEEAKLWQHYNKDDAWYEKKGKNIIENKTKRIDVFIAKIFIRISVYQLECRCCLNNTKIENNPEISIYITCNFKFNIFNFVKISYNFYYFKQIMIVSVSLDC